MDYACRNRVSASFWPRRIAAIMTIDAELCPWSALEREYPVTVPPMLWVAMDRQE
jgi:hypothetical protein